MTDYIFLGSKITADGDSTHEIKRHLLLGRKADKPRQRAKKLRHHFANNGLCSQSYGFISSHVRMWELDHKEGWVARNWFFQTVVLRKTLKSPLDSEKFKPANPKGNQSWIFIGRNDAEAPMMWRANSLENTLMLGKTEGRRRRGWQRMRWLDGIIDSMDMSYIVSPSICHEVMGPDAIDLIFLNVQF